MNLFVKKGHETFDVVVDFTINETVDVVNVHVTRVFTDITVQDRREIRNAFILDKVVKDWILSNWDKYEELLIGGI